MRERPTERLGGCIEHFEACVSYAFMCQHSCQALPNNASSPAQRSPGTGFPIFPLLPGTAAGACSIPCPSTLRSSHPNANLGSGSQLGFPHCQAGLGVFSRAPTLLASRQPGTPGVMGYPHGHSLTERFPARWVRGFGTRVPNSAFGHLCHVQICFCSKDHTPAVSLPSKGLSVPSPSG